MASLSHFLAIAILLQLTASSIVWASKPIVFPSVAPPNPFTSKAALLRYWNRKIPRSAHHPRPDFLVSKLSPLSALDSATYSSIAAAGPDGLSAHLQAFCAAAHLLCDPSVRSSLASGDANFASYHDIIFTNYGTGRAGGLDAFKSYSDDQFAPPVNFRRYSANSSGHDESFATYSRDGVLVIDNFTSYGTGATTGDSGFTTYGVNSTVSDMVFSNYDADANGRVQSFATYSDDTSAGDQSFRGYGKHGNSVPTTFTSYYNNTRIIDSVFSGYGEDANGAADAFTSYGDNSILPGSSFQSYGENGKAGSDSFTSYRNQTSVGFDTFASYAKGGLGSTATFTGYGDPLNSGRENFKGYGEGATVKPNITFKTYYESVTTFKAYGKFGARFKNYKNTSSATATAAANDGDARTAEPVKRNRGLVEPGRFFRESELKTGTVMPMPDVRDKMPARSFLPRSIAGRIPFSAAEVRRVFGIPADTALGKALADTVAECERAPSRGETKRCATSAEDVIDFAVSVLGTDTLARSTASAAGLKGDILIGDVTGIDGGKVTHAVSCHQSLFPYLVYYCHSVPKVRVYEAEILAVHTKEKINHGVAICHLDTSDWSAGHGAFVALGPGPGKIEVCHWIFMGDMTWTVAN